jgi:hypothetical protein
LLLAVASAIVAEPEEGAPEDAAEDGPRYAVAAGEILGSNVVVQLFDRFVVGADYAQTSWASMARNLRAPWIFDHDGFSVNEIAHPYHGSIYFAAGRSNGLGFWGSAAGAALGSATWELFGETEHPAINDITTTTMGGVVLGEMSHRLFHLPGVGDTPLRFVASPMDALNEAVFKDEPELDRAPADIALSLRAGLCFPDLDMAKERNLSPGRTEPLGLVSEGISYGDPFGEDSAEPFSHFEQRLRVGFSSSSYEVSFFSYGKLCSFPLADRPSWKLSAGLGLHYDFIFSSLVDISANSLGISLVSARRLGGGFTISSQLHLNAVAMGTTDDVFLRERAEAAGSGADIRNYDFGYGEGAKVYILASQPRLGSLGLEYVAFGLHAIPSAQEEDSDFDYAIIGMLELYYEHKASQHLSIGLSYSLYDKRAFFDPGDGIDESMRSVTLYVKIL